MSVFRVQMVREMANAPAVGKWGVYTTFWFEASDSLDWASSAIAQQVGRLADGHDPTQTSSAHTVYGLKTGANNARLLVYKFNAGGSLTFHQDVTFTYSPVPLPSSGTVTRMPSQCMMTIGYKSIDLAVRQRGRARWFIGPVSIVGALVLDGTIRLSAAYTADLAAQAQASIANMAAMGAELRVHSGKGAAQTFLTPVELYVDDVFDVRRSRRTFQRNQERLSLL